MKGRPGINSPGGSLPLTRPKRIANVPSLCSANVRNRGRDSDGVPAHGSRRKLSPCQNREGKTHGQDAKSALRWIEPGNNDAGRLRDLFLLQLVQGRAEANYFPEDCEQHAGNRDRLGQQAEKLIDRHNDGFKRRSAIAIKQFAGSRCTEFGSLFIESFRRQFTNTQLAESARDERCFGTAGFVLAPLAATECSTARYS